MTRNCDVCGRTYMAKNPHSKFCGDACRKRNERGTVVHNTTPPPAGESVLVTVTREALEAARKLNSVPGQQALRLAEQMAGPETGAGLAALSKALSTVMAEALGNVKVADDEIAKQKAKRDAKRAG